jgi:hypothetical protein
MDIELTTDAIRETGRGVGRIAGRPRQNVYDDVAYEAIDAAGARAERSMERPVAPVGGPEYTGRA